MAQIQPVEFPLNLGSANDLDVRIAAFGAADSSCSVSVQLRELVAPSGADGGGFKVLYTGVLRMDSATFAQWGQDNFFVIQWAANQLGVTLV